MSINLRKDNEMNSNSAPAPSNNPVNPGNPAPAPSSPPNNPVNPGNPGNGQGTGTNSNKSLFLGIGLGVAACALCFMLFGGNKSSKPSQEPVSAPKQVSSNTTTSVNPPKAPANNQNTISQTDAAPNYPTPTTNYSDRVKSVNSVAVNSTYEKAPVGPIHMNAIVEAAESSADRENNYIHSALLTIDGNPASCWSEGVKGLGQGEYVIYKFNNVYSVSGIRMWPGHQKSRELYYKNSRPRIVRIEGSDGSISRFRMDDVLAKHTLHFRQPINVESIKIVIEDAYSGNTWQDTSISEVEFY